MGRIIKPLSDAEIKKAKVQDKEHVFYDGDGLQLTIRTNGSKIFEFRYKSPVTNKYQKIALGKYPILTLSEARDKRFELQKQLYNGIDPKIERDKKELVSVAMVAELFKEHIKDGLAPNTYKRNVGIINRDIIRVLGNHAIKDVTRFDIVSMIQDIESRGVVESVKMALKLSTRMWRHALALGYVDHNVCLDVDRGVLKKSIPKNLPHMVEVDDIKEMLEKIHISQIAPIVKLAILFSLHTFLRPYNVRFLEWSEVDFDNKVIMISAEKMKMRKAHIVPLSDETIRLLREAWKFNGQNNYVFLMNTGKVMSDMTMNRSLERMGYKDKQTTHGFRHTASTLLHENIVTHGVGSDAIERQMAHVTGGIRGVYNKAEYISERVKLMHWWSSFLCTLYTSENHTV